MQRRKGGRKEVEQKREERSWERGRKDEKEWAQIR